MASLINLKYIYLKMNEECIAILLKLFQKTEEKEYFQIHPPRPVLHSYQNQTKAFHKSKLYTNIPNEY